MTQFHAQPYDIDADGFYFETAEEYTTKAEANRNRHGDPVEEYMIQFIDGDGIDAELAKAAGLYQNTIEDFIDACDEWDDHQKTMAIINMDELGGDFEPDMDPQNYDIDVYHVDSMTDLADMFIEEGMLGDIPDHLQFYIDVEKYAHDLSMDYSETTIGGTNIIWRAA